MSHTKSSPIHTRELVKGIYIDATTNTQRNVWYSYHVTNDSEGFLTGFIEDDDKVLMEQIKYFISLGHRVTLMTMEQRMAKIMSLSVNR